MPPVLQYRDMSTSHISTSGFSAVLTAMVAIAQVAAADIQSRIDACHAAGGGVVKVAAGRYENVKPIVMKSNVELHLEEGAVIHASTNYCDYPYMPGQNRGAFISAVDATNILVTGKGVLECSGDRMPHVEKVPGRWRGIHFFRCRNLKLQDFTLRNAHSWGCYVQECDGVEMRNLTVFNHANYNNDGIDIASRNVLVEDCDIDSEDDAIVFKNHNPEFSVENVVVRRCRISCNTSFIKLGTETRGYFRNIRVSDCELDCRAPVRKRIPYPKEFGLTTSHTGSAGLAVYVIDGGFAEDIVFSDIRMKRGIMVPVCVRLDRRNPPPGCEPVPIRNKDGRLTCLRNVRFERVTMDEATTSWFPSTVTGGNGLRPENIVFRDCRFTMKGCSDSALATLPVPENNGRYPGVRMFGAVTPAYGLYVRHADNVILENVRFDTVGTEVRRNVFRED